MFDKLQVALSQGLAAGPHGTKPPRFPVFSKPIMNFRGLGAGSRILRSPEDYEHHHTPGHLWMTLLEGAHISTDVAVADGKPVWWRHVTGVAVGEGMFDYGRCVLRARSRVSKRPAGLIRKNSKATRPTQPRNTAASHREALGYRPVARPYGAGWATPYRDLYAIGLRFVRRPRDGFSLVLCGPHGRRYRHPPAALVNEVASMPGVSSVQITFHEDRPPEQHSMPPGGFRVALVNSFGLEKGRAAREVLRKHFLGPEPAVNIPSRT